MRIGLFYQIQIPKPWTAESETCSGQEKTDTPLSHLSEGLPCIRADIAQRRMLPCAVVEHLDVLNHICSGFLACGVVTVHDPFSLSAAEEPFHHGIIQTRALTAPATADPVRG
jgi:hypothetical protein